MKKRTLEDILKIALDTFPVVLLNGARQVGKSTYHDTSGNKYVCTQTSKAHLE
jgi:predicted AAA+ superfamily ATPase